MEKDKRRRKETLKSYIAAMLRCVVIVASGIVALCESISGPSSPLKSERGV